MAKCSIFKDVFDKNNPKHIEVDLLLDYIKSGRWANKIHQIRTEIDLAERKRLKTFLPSICFSGTFGQRYDDKIITHSGFVILDFDHVENINEQKEIFCKDEFTYSCFISPSGDGLKVLVKIPQEKENHKDYYRGLMQKYPSLDPTSINLSRICFVSYDIDLFLNKKSKIFSTKGKSDKKIIQNSEAQRTDYKKIDIAVDMVRFANDGEKHHALIKASRLLGGFIASGLVEEHEAIRILETEINKKDIIDFKGAQKTINDGITYGKNDPIYEKEYKQKVEKIKNEVIIIEGEPAKDVIYLDDVRENIIYSFVNGTSRGETTHFKELDDVYRMSRRELTIVHGMANHGKTEFMIQLALIKSVKDGHKWGVFSPENYPADEFYKSIVHSYVGKSTEKHHKNQMTIGELNNAMDFVRDHFYFMYPENNDPTPTYINNRFTEMILKHNIDGCIIDPYNQLDTDLSNTGGKEHLYLSKFLSKEKKFAVEHNVFFFILTHPTAGLEQFKGNYKMPKVYDLSGGAMWNNKADNIICVHRPNYSDWTDKTVIIASQKIKKQKLNGIPGEVYFTFDRMNNRYYSPSGNPLEEEKEKLLINFYESKKEDDEPF